MQALFRDILSDNKDASITMVDAKQDQQKYPV